mmetsp:Transcript_52181/g.138186  ORF Transcript_52181/g.138186 Transcript_52181/m.138186 type:complete len:206 (-) Transcript_52181:4990-5607(-)
MGAGSFMLGLGARRRERARGSTKILGTVGTQVSTMVRLCWMTKQRSCYLVNPAAQWTRTRQMTRPSVNWCLLEENWGAVSDGCQGSCAAPWLCSGWSKQPSMPSCSTCRLVRKLRWVRQHLPLRRPGPPLPSPQPLRSHVPRQGPSSRPPPPPSSPRPQASPSSARPRPRWCRRRCSAAASTRTGAAGGRAARRAGRGSGTDGAL